MAEVECPHGGDQATCPPCQKAKQPKPTPPTYGSAFPARYDGQCHECNLPISVGQSIILPRGDPGDYRSPVHESCRPR